MRFEFPDRRESDEDVLARDPIERCGNRDFYCIILHERETGLVFRPVAISHHHTTDNDSNEEENDGYVHVSAKGNRR